jgi:hypothetical protein
MIKKSKNQIILEVIYSMMTYLGLIISIMLMSHLLQSLNRIHQNLIKNQTTEEREDDK